MKYFSTKLWLSVGCFLVVLVGYFCLAPNPPKVGLMHVPGADKLEHFAAYLVLMIWFNLGNITRKGRFLIALALVAMGVGMEYVQLWEGWRTFEIRDMAANTAGISAGLMLTVMNQNQKKRIKSAAITCLALISLCFLPASVPAGLFSEVHTTGFVWGRPDLTLGLVKQAGTEDYSGDVLAVINEWNVLLKKVRGAPTITLTDASDPDITVTITRGSGQSLGICRTEDRSCSQLCP